ncbi:MULTISPECIES: ATP-binding protein [Blautia]|uniref:Stage 0 sporulation protein A homolog n=2 Tax=Blautia obeum TaxID=40520 RepID=D4LWE6_9FIRM|nr:MULTISPECIES: ATP-binding protein [Blautia]RHA46060.1 hybrid sensor histidine kinase/response regulator [Blautia obeum]RHE37222.1 hybrid sensor histidine kinase/response regulator [Blautia obeum]CBL21949.1 Signal transduction histidine kinase [Blautia obeum A2-162]
MILDIKRKKKEKRIRLIGGLIGICVAVVSLFYFFHAEKAEAEKRMVEIVNYVKVQCSTYTHYNESSESKSLLRAIESARQMSTNINMETENGGQLSRELLKGNLQTLWVDGIIVLDKEGKTDCEYSTDESLANEITEYLQKEIIMDFAGYEERSYSERFIREDGSRIDIAACARKDAPGIVAVYYYTSPEFVRNYTLTIQGLLNGYSVQKDGTIIVADDGTVVASNDESMLGQNTSGNEVVQAMKKHTDSQHIYHLKNEGTGCYGIMLKQRDYYIYAYLPDIEVFHNLPLSVAGVVFLYFLIFSIFLFWSHRTNQVHQKLEQEKDEKYKAELLIAAKKAEAANEAKTEFLQRMSHDIRTPINGICGLVNMAEHYADNMEKQTEYRTKVKEASNLLLELVNDVLDMSKLESGEIVLEEIPFNLSKISREVFVVIEQMAAEQNIQIKWEKKEITHRDLIGSPGYVKRVMMNILSNAMKYNRENGHIYISCIEIPSGQPETTTMEFVCRDTGIGMTEEFQKHIFEPFAQEHSGSRTKFAGTGLGMPIAKKLIEKMGGTITFESVEGVGTTFVIRVPFRIDTDRDSKVETGEKTEVSIRGLHILLAEDNELNMEIAEFMLQNEGAEVTKAWDGQEAVKIFEKSRSGEFDVILMDIMMPVMNGYEAAKMIRSLDKEDAKAIPIIAMTANAFAEDRIRAKEAGMDEHVAKPVDVELLIKVIHRLVE